MDGTTSSQSPGAATNPNQPDQDIDQDDDGLDDGVEAGLGFDPAAWDSEGHGLPDGLTHRLRQQGITDLRDSDRDGIPDGLETTNPLLDWGTFRPTVGQRDLFFEFVRLLPAEDLMDVPPGLLPLLTRRDLGPMYGRAAAAFDEAGFATQWAETRIWMPGRYPADDLAPTQLARASSHAGNPFVFPILVMTACPAGGYCPAGWSRPQQSASFVHLEANLVMHFVEPGSQEPFTLDGLGELRVLGHAEFGHPLDEVMVGAGFAANGRIYLDLNMSQFMQPMKGVWRFSWTPYWFQGPFTRAQGDRVEELQLVSTDFADDALRHTMVHEIGHSLSLCHPHEDACVAGWPAADVSRRGESVMSYGSAQSSEVFLPSEQSRMRDFVDCPPVAALLDLVATRERGAVWSRWDTPSNHVGEIEISGGLSPWAVGPCGRPG